MSSIAFLIAICNLALLIYGIVLRSKFHNGDECSMTYSVIRFLLLPPFKENNLPYRLFKFTDGRDERWDHLVDYGKPIGTDNRAYHIIVDDENWCKPSNPSGKPGHIVLYIPGHEGSFMQARSIGAHGTLLTHRGREFPKKISPDKVLEEIWEGARHANAEYVDDFLFDVYTVDFNEEGAGLHGSRLFAQTYFIKSSIKRITNECDLEHGNITIVAHSMGGLVARKAIVELNKERMAHGKSTIVNTLVTLATPHSALSLIFEPSVFYFRSEMLKQEEVYPDALATVVSISGGLKDELINPPSCHINRKSFYSINSSNIIKHGLYETKKQSQFGMDHNAIVWCHHVLRFVRNIIHAGQNHLSLKDTISNNVKDTSSCDYGCQCQENEDSLVKMYGTLGAFVIKASMLYHARIMAILFTMNGIFYLFTLRKFKSWTGGLRYIAVPLFASVVIRLFPVVEEIDFYSNTLIAYNAMTIHSLILNVLYRLIPKALKIVPTATKSRQYMKHQLKLIAILTIIGTAALLYFSRIKGDVLIINETSMFSFVFIGIVIATFWNVIAMGFYGNELEKSVAAVVTVSYPLTVIGKIIYALSVFTIKGQAKSEPYNTFRQSQSKDSFVVTSFIVRFELLTYVVFVCLPLFILTMYCKCKEHGKPSFSKSKVMDKIK